MKKPKSKKKAAKKQARFCEVEAIEPGEPPHLFNINRTDILHIHIDTEIKIPAKNGKVQLKFESTKITIDAEAKKIKIEKFKPPQLGINL